MISYLKNIGFDRIVTTPHIMKGMFDNSEEDLIQAHDQFCNQLSTSEVDFKIELASEYICG